MNKGFQTRLERIERRFQELESILQTPLDSTTLAAHSKEYSDLTPMVESIRTLNQARIELADLDAIRDEPSMRDMVYEEETRLKETIEQTIHHIRILLLPKDIDDDRNAILEIRAGTGGEEASLFADNLLRMYQRFAQVKGWSFEILTISDTGLGGIKEAQATVSGKGVFAQLKFESGVHRVQRVPETESSGRIHTSAATVAVLPEVEEVDIQIDEKDLQIDVYRASGAGGQHVNTTDSAVRITHIPTGVVVCQQDERSQHKNKAKALKILRSRIYESERQRKEAEQAASRKTQVGSGDRSERIRTYNFPQGRVTDHRIHMTLHKIDQIMQGEGLDEMIQALITDYQAKCLAADGED